MGPHSPAFRKWAEECLDFAKLVSNPQLRQAFLAMAGRWMDAADGLVGTGTASGFSPEGWNKQGPDHTGIH
jgi:hypothetical protein